MKNPIDKEGCNPVKKQKRGKGGTERLMSAYAAMALQRGVDDALIVETSKVYTAPWVRMKCQFGCAGYGERFCCPPLSPTPEQTRAVLDSYSWALLLHRYWRKGQKMAESLSDVAVDIERTIFLDGFYKAFSMGCGPCTRCKTCNASGTCAHPDQVRPSMEACGIDVFATAREHVLPIAVVRNHNEDRNLFSLVLIE
jgi:predicted metal-binding protein